MPLKLRNMQTEFEYENIKEKIEKFDVIKGRFTRFLLDHYWLFVPLYLIVGIPMDLLTYGVFNTSPTAILGAITVFIVVFLSIRLFRKIPYTFKRIWDRNIILSKGSEKDTECEIKFLDKFEKNLNSKIGVICGAIFVCIFLLGVAVIPHILGDLLNNKDWLIISFAIFLLFFGLYIHIGGMILYRMYVTAKYVSKISQEFDLRIQILHPDKCGGLKPIGDLCLSNSFILIVMGIYFAIAIAIYQDREFLFAYVFGLLIVIVFSMLSFIWPAYSVHKIMLKEKIKKLEILDRVVSDQIPVINKPVKMELSEIKEYEVLQDQYRKVEEFGTWPFDTSILRKFIASEIVLLFSGGIALLIKVLNKLLGL